MKKKDKLVRFKTAVVFALLLAFSAISCNAPINDIDSNILPNANSRKKSYPKTTTLGIVWNKYTGGDSIPDPIFPPNNPDGSLGSLNACDPNVIKINETDYRMWYSKVTTEIADSNEFSRYQIAYATSTDGINWTDHDVVAGLSPDPTSDAPYNVAVRGGVRVSSVIKAPYYEGEIFKMWYLGKPILQTEDNWKLYYAESIDGINWNKQYFDELYLTIGKPEFTTGTFYEKYVSSAAVMADTSNYKMWFGGYNQENNSKIGFASSNEGTEIDWKIVGEVIKPGFASTGHFDAYDLENPFVLKDGDVYRMWYSGKKHNWQIGLAYSLDGKNFDYYSETHQPVMKPFSGFSRWERLGIRSVCVIKDETAEGITMYKMWYAAESNLGNFRIGYAESVKLD